MKSLNKVQLIGHTGNDPELKEVSAGLRVCRLSLATSETWKDKDGNKQERTEWHNLMVWGKLGEMAQKYIKKGTLIYVEGKIRSNTIEQQDGTSKKYVNINVDSLIMLSPKTQSGQATNHQQPVVATQSPPGAAPVQSQTTEKADIGDWLLGDGEDDLPF